LAEQGHTDYVEELEALADMGGVRHMSLWFYIIVVGVGVVMV
jgi:hypothetical protein